MITPDDYGEASFLAREIAKGMKTRLGVMKLNPRQVLDVGCGLGIDAEALTKRYPEAQVVAIDLLQSFLHYGKKKQKSRTDWVLADSHTLPLRSHTVDLIFANLLLPWVQDPVLILREWRRVLRPGGLVLFSCLGPDTFKEWRDLEKTAFIPHLVDMHNVGDALVQAGFVEPILEVENLTLTYRSRQQCQQELVKSGMWAEVEELEAKQTDAEGARFPVTFEVVYGHAWCPATQGFTSDEQGVVRIPVSQLRSRKKK